MFLFLTTALAAPRFDSVACAEVADGPPKGASTLVESVLPAIHGVHRKLHQRKQPDRPDAAVLQSWLPTELPRDRFGARAARVATEAGEQLLIEVQAPRRPALVEANVTAIVDTSGGMTTTVAQRYPALQDAPPTGLQRTVTRLDLAKVALLDLVDTLPEGSRFTLVLTEGASGRVFLPPTTSPEAMRRAIDLLEPHMLDPKDELLQEAIETAGLETFLPCADNRALVFTYRTDNAVTANALKATKVLTDAGAQVWTFGLGTYEDLRPEQYALQQGTNRASWLFNTRSEAQLIWDTLFSAGGSVPADLALNVTVDGEQKLDTRLERMDSSSHLVRTLDLPSDATVDVSIAAGETVLVDAPPPSTPLASAPLWARARIAATEWAQGASPSLHADEGVPSELAAWSVYTGAEPAPSREVWLHGLWADPSPGGPYLVADVQPDIELELEPKRAKLVVGDTTLEPIAWEEQDRRWRLVYRSEASEAQLAYGELRTAPRKVGVAGRRSANDVIIRHGRSLQGADALLPDAVAAAELYQGDDILTELVASLYVELEAFPDAERWASRCIDARVARTAVQCRLHLGHAFEGLARLEDADEVYMDGVKLFPWSHELWFAAGEVAFAMDEMKRAELRFLEAMHWEAPSNPTCVRLADVMERRELPGFAALALARALLLDPTDEDVRTRLFTHLENRWPKAGRQYGKLGTIRPPRGKTSPAMLTKLLFRWGQAYRRELAVNPDSTDRWHTEIPRPFDVLRFDRILLSGAIRLGYPPDAIPEDRREVESEIGPLLETWDPPIY